MFLDYFLRAREYLRKQGLHAAVVMGSPVSGSDLKALDRETDLPMPPELRRFYLELGDGFQFMADETRPDLIGWEPMRLADHRICNRGFGAEIQEEVIGEIGSPSPRTNSALLKQEMERRKR